MGKGLKDFCTCTFNSLGVGGLLLTCVKGINGQHINKIRKCGGGSQYDSIQQRSVKDEGLLLITNEFKVIRSLAGKMISGQKYLLRKPQA